MQIMQFLIGFTFALGHLFVEYTVPVSTPYTVTSTFTSAVSSPSAAISGAISSAVTSAAAAAASTPIASWLKKLAFRAAGEEGLAENVLNDQGKPFGPDANDIVETVKREVRYRTQYETVACIDTEGQAFAIYLNLIYLAPLTWLFVRFFVRSYSRRTDPKARHQTKSGKLSKSAEDAAHSVNRELDQPEDIVGGGAENLKRIDGQDSSDKLDTPKSADKRRVSATIERQFKRFEEGNQSDEEAVKEVADKAKSNGSAGAGRLRKKASEGHERLRSMWEEGMDGRTPPESAYETVTKAKDTALEGMQGGKATVAGSADEVVSKLEESAEEAVQKVKQAVSSATNGAGEKFETEMEGGVSPESEAREPKSVMQEFAGRAKEATRKDSATEQDGLDVDDQRYKSSDPDKNENQRPAELRAGESKGTDASWEDLHASELKQQKGDRKEDATQPERSESPDLSRTLSRDSTHKVQTHSKIPRPKDSSRSRSPVKKAAATNRTGTSKTNSRASPVKEEKEISHDGAIDDGQGGSPEE